MTPRQERFAARMRLLRSVELWRKAKRRGSLAAFWVSLRSDADLLRAPAAQPAGGQLPLLDDPEQHRARLIEEHLDIADLVARRYSRRAPPGIAYDDLRSVAALAITMHAQEYNPARGRARSFFWQCAARDVIDYVRKEGLRYRMLSPLEEYRESFNWGGGERDVESMIRQLPFLQGMALTLKYLDGVSEAEASRRLDISIRGYRLLCRRGLEKLKSLANKA